MGYYAKVVSSTEVWVCAVGMSHDHWEARVIIVGGEVTFEFAYETAETIGDFASAVSFGDAVSSAIRLLASRGGQW